MFIQEIWNFSCKLTDVEMILDKGKDLIKTQCHFTRKELKHSER